MPWPLPAPADIADRASAAFESAQNPDGTLAFPGIDARSPNTVAGTLARVQGMTSYDCYLYQQYLSYELFPDTAQDYLPEHLAVWGITQIPPSFAAAQILVAGATGTPVPAGAQLTAPSNAVYTVTTGGTLAGVGGTAGALLTVTANIAGAAGTLSPGTVLSFASPIAGLAPQSGVVQTAGIVPGQDQEGLESARARMLTRIRKPGSGGSQSDYVTWALQANSAAQFVQVVPNTPAAGSVTVIVGMAGPRVPTAGELAGIAAYIAPLRPVDATVVMQAAALQAVPVTLHLNPDSTAIRMAVQSALALFFATDSQISLPFSPASANGNAPTSGGVCFISRLDNALSNADGETSHERSAPSADVVAPVGTLLTLGTVTFD